MTPQTVASRDYAFWGLMRHNFAAFGGLSIRCAVISFSLILLMNYIICAAHLRSRPINGESQLCPLIWVQLKSCIPTLEIGFSYRRLSLCKASLDKESTVSSTKLNFSIKPISRYGIDICFSSLAFLLIFLLLYIFRCF